MKQEDLIILITALVFFLIGSVGSYLLFSESCISKTVYEMGEDMQVLKEENYTINL